MRIPRRCCLPFLLLLAACSQAPVAAGPATAPQDPPANRHEPVMCKEPRPEMCTALYDPVCATRDTGIRCITAPCPSTEQKTMGNSCSACNDPKVMSYVPGECPAK